MAKKDLSPPQVFLRWIIGILVVALLGLAGYSQYAGQTLLPKIAIASAVTPAQGFFSGLADSANDYLRRLKLRSNLEYEYNQILAQNEQMVYQVLRTEELENENLRLRDLLGLRESYIDKGPLAAKVISSEPGNWFSTFTLNRGSRDGVQENMAVINASGLIGQVSEVFPTSCKVITIIDSNTSIACLIESSRDQGIVKGALLIDGQPLCRMYYLPNNSVPRPGDTVVTSGEGEEFPKGLVLGTVRESTRYMEENKNYIVVEPTADFQHIEEVIILRYVPETIDITGRESDELYIQPVPTPRPQSTVSTDLYNATPGPLPNAPGRASDTLPPTDATFAPPAQDGQADEGEGGADGMAEEDEMFSAEEQAIRDQFLGGE